MISAIFTRFAELGSVRAVWLWLRTEGLLMPVQRTSDELRWIAPTYPGVHRVLTHPSYAGAYVYGRTRRERRVDEDGGVRTRARQLGRSDWQVLIEDHHPGHIDWTPSRPTRPASAPTSAPRPTSPAPAQSGRAAPCCKG